MPCMPGGGMPCMPCGGMPGLPWGIPWDGIPCDGIPGGGTSGAGPTTAGRPYSMGTTKRMAPTAVVSEETERIWSMMHVFSAAFSDPSDFTSGFLMAHLPSAPHASKDSSALMTLPGSVRADSRQLPRPLSTASMAELMPSGVSSLDPAMGAGVAPIT